MCIVIVMIIIIIPISVIWFIIFNYLSTYCSWFTIKSSGHIKWMSSIIVTVTIDLLL